MIQRVLIVLFLLVTWASAGNGQEAVPQNPVAAKVAVPVAVTTRGIMHALFEPVQVLLPLSFNAAEFASLKNRPVIQKQVDALARNAGLLESHAKTQNPSFQFLSHGLARDVGEIKTWFDKRKYDEARFVLHNLTEYCTSCHTKAVSERNFPGIGEFFSHVDIKSLPQLEQAQLLIATRQFDQGLEAYEGLFQSHEYIPAEIAASHAFTDYLKVCIRVKRDLNRPLPVLRQWRNRPGVPKHMRTQTAAWIAALESIDKRKLLEMPAMSHARELLSIGKQHGRLPLDKDRLIYFIAASAQLDQVINAPSTKPNEFAEAFYLLGIAESVIGRSFWISQTEFFLEAAIRAAPGSTTAMRAYQELEEQIQSEYSGSSGIHVPPDVATLLGELRKMAFKG